MNTLSVALDALDVSDRLRVVDPVAVSGLVVSMAGLGLLSPVEVTHEAGRYRLISGAHRVAAALQLGWERIGAIVFEGDPDQIRLREIDENLYRRELSPYDQAAFLAERAAVCQRLGIIPKQAGRPKVGNSAKLALITYEAELADKFGISRRDLFRSLRRRRSIDDAAWRLIAGTKLADKGAHLDRLCDVPRERQREVVQAFLAPPTPGESRPSFASLCDQASGFRSPKVPPSRDRRRALVAAWEAADGADRGWFIAQLPPADRTEVRRLLDQGEV